MKLGRLQPGRHVGGHHVLRSLTNVRDGVVHRGVQPTAAQANEIVRQALRLCQEQIPHVIGWDPFAD